MAGEVLGHCVRSYVGRIRRNMDGHARVSFMMRSSLLNTECYDARQILRDIDARPGHTAFCSTRSTS
jgi:hypothetical protein